ncbi:cyclophane-forming radical SAM peptide maturase AmcB [Actinokineospora sp.]|uniref:cyclophane-forming radical SAM peptide maturase AmcB n=1 Tax=Actinokineospora sp. TaxID=1872133 RepID=UPI00403829E2
MDKPLGAIPTKRCDMTSVVEPSVQDRFRHWIKPEPGTIITQPTSFCPLDCTYCYLPRRHLNLEMATATAEAIVSGIPAHWGTETPLEVVWHGGEPLVVGRAKFGELLTPFQHLLAEGRIVHRIQTGATLITDEWCEFFGKHQIDVGVSIDGPAHVNVNRINRGGHPMFDRIVAGIETLKRNGIGFTTLAVVTDEATSSAAETLSFFSDLGCTWVGLNIEAQEAANVGGLPPAFEQVRRYWRDVFEWSAANPDMVIREVRSVFGFLGLDADVRSTDGRHDLIPTIGWDGDVILLSPELLDVEAPEYDNFVVGNVNDDPLTAILNRASDVRYVGEFMDGLEACKKTCEFWDLCQGAHAGNRFFEHGTFTATETRHCQTSFQAPALALADLMRESE